MHPKSFQHLVKECVLEVLSENLGGTSKCPECGTPDGKCNCSIVARVKAYGILKKKVESGSASAEEIELVARERPWVQSILRKAGYGVQGGMYMREGFDPQSWGPNPVTDNPYPAWNSKMRQLEEEEGQNSQPTGETFVDHPIDPSPVKEALELTATGVDDDWSRPVYTDTDGNIYVDVNCGDGEPAIHTTTSEGEPEVPVRNYTINGNTNQANRAPNALCPRCKNSKPELMKQTPDGKMSCTSCHWEENPGEPRIR